MNYRTPINKKPLPLHISAILKTVTITTVASLTSVAAIAQSAPRGSAALLLEEVVVTARKREESAQDTPIAVSAYGSDQLDALKVRDLSSLAVSMPNVAMDDAGTTRGIANFSIRGLGVNSSIPSIDPTVGVFVDGVYMGTNAGVVLDMFDLQSIEVLRGPQGILFGRNVTGGAVLVNTKLPTEQFEANLRGIYEAGGEAPNKYWMGSVSGPVSDSVAAKLSVYTNRDDGWFKNEVDGEAFGQTDTVVVRPVITWDINDTTRMVLRYEYQESESTGAAGQNHTNGRGLTNPFSSFDRDSHEFANDEEGLLEARGNMFSATVDKDVAFGDGTVTNIFGWREFSSFSFSDIDSTALSLFHSIADMRTEQYSNELRYSGNFGDRWTLTSGLYYFTNEVNYYEERNQAFGAINQYGGGDYEVTSMGAFTAADFALTDQWTLTAGIRFTKEDKEAQVSNLTLNTNQACNIIDGTCPIHFDDEESWSNWSPKLGFMYELDMDARVYGSWSRGYRSGGYNLRNTSTRADVVPGPFDEETVNTFELGYKMSLGDRGRLNAAIFHTQIEDMQREINYPDPIASVTQDIRNTADATLMGIEIDATYALTDTLLLTATLGYTDSAYDEVTYDLNGDGVIDGADEDLDIPRAAELTYSIGLSHDMDLGDAGYVSSRISFAYRDESAYTDDNYGYIDEQEILDLGVDYHTNDEKWVVGLYGKNLLDTVKHGGDTQLPASLGGGTFSPLSKGRVYGLELTYNY
ncbi:TonB-dependent receptor [Aestuariicella hydrocarbonica]|uniref:TonB-dependent receptor n=1 Tax=Pseudomaricurvus hydrocarbonicus TaxID=1470433 RepID=A0A9E5MLN0_9GAMM|nr:TonB-dependent receptor [Aestuariicella hydrocarbonica]NHO64220.1 TonB-dependent receptor [Aestuariicella hydrocarbonica]